MMRGASFYGDSNERMRSSARTRGCDALCASLCPHNIGKLRNAGTTGLSTHDLMSVQRGPGLRKWGGWGVQGNVGRRWLREVQSGKGQIIVLGLF